MTEYIITLQYSSSISKFETSVRLLNEENKKIEFLTDHAAKDPFNKLFPLRLDQSLPSRGKCRTDPAVHRKNANQMSNSKTIFARSPFFVRPPPTEGHIAVQIVLGNGNAMQWNSYSSVHG
jgi:hypothetical protein